MIQNKIKEILDTLNNLQENLLFLPDDILLSIDPREHESFRCELGDVVNAMTNG